MVIELKNNLITQAEIETLKRRIDELRGFFDYDKKLIGQETIEKELSDPKVWSDSNRINELNQELNVLKKQPKNSTQ